MFELLPAERGAAGRPQGGSDERYVSCDARSREFLQRLLPRMTEQIRLYRDEIVQRRARRGDANALVPVQPRDLAALQRQAAVMDKLAEVLRVRMAEQGAHPVWKPLQALLRRPPSEAVPDAVSATHGGGWPVIHAANRPRVIMYDLPDLQEYLRNVQRKYMGTHAAGLGQRTGSGTSGPIFMEAPLRVQLQPPAAAAAAATQPPSRRRRRRAEDSAEEREVDSMHDAARRRASAARTDARSSFERTRQIVQEQLRLQEQQRQRTLEQQRQSTAGGGASGTGVPAYGTPEYWDYILSFFRR